MSVAEQLGRRFARLVTVAVTREPRLWRVLRPALRTQFDRLAPRWDAMRGPDALAPYEAALERVEGWPHRALDVGTGTGAGAEAIARRFADAEVVGLDVAPAMVEHARRKLADDVAGRVRFELGDASRLPYPDSSFELVAHANMIPFYDELARVLAPGGYAIFAFSSGPRTPIYVPPERLRDELERRGFADFAEISAGSGTAVVARKRETS
jgi:ubiquinone/menaquinone biosynthesis C-methylase UbiE